MNSDFRQLLDYYPRLKSFYEIGSVQRCELEAFVSSALQAGMTGVTADGELVSPGDPVWVLSSIGNVEPTTVKDSRPVTTYYLYDNIPVSSSFSTREAAEAYKRDAFDSDTNS